jgi:site-specific DNA-methyltransferase (cytosine-N4-specific)
MRTSALYTTPLGAAYVGDSLQLLSELESDTVDLIVTSPPFPLLRKKVYGNENQSKYVGWLLNFEPELRRVLRPSGSLVIDIGGAYVSGKPVRSLHSFCFLLAMCEGRGWHLAQEFYWYNPSKLPSPIEWVNKRKIRAKDSVNTIWWLAKTEHPKANIEGVRVGYSKRMRKLLKDPETYYKPRKRPSGHDIGQRFAKDLGGAIPPNLLDVPNTESNSKYIQNCSKIGVHQHPARFPELIPEFFVKFLTEEGDIVLDIFAGSNTTGAVAERLRRKWLAFEIDCAYLASSSFRFVDDLRDHELQHLYNRLISGKGSTVQLAHDYRQQVLSGIG